MSLHTTVKSAYLSFEQKVADNRLLDFKWFVEQEVNSWKYWMDLPIRRRLWNWWHGFPSPYGKLYDLTTHEPTEFISELQRYRLYRSLNGDHRYLVDDKLSQYWMLCDFPENRPTAFGLVDRGWLHPVAGTASNEPSERVSEAIPDLLERQGKLVLKSLRGKGGKEVRICEFDGEYTLDGDRVSEEELIEVVSSLSNYLVSEYVHQHDYANELYPHSPNTIRLLTIWDDEAGELFTAFAAQRIGTEQSKPIDNFSVGGLAAEIDLETGQLGSAVQFPFTGDVLWYDAHPDTHIRLEGYEIPNWDYIRETVEAIASRNTNIPAIGWDVIVNESGEPIVIEANTGTDFDMVQVHRPLLKDPRVRRVAARHLPSVDPPPEGASIEEEEIEAKSHIHAIG